MRCSPCLRKSTPFESARRSCPGRGSFQAWRPGIRCRRHGSGDHGRAREVARLHHADFRIHHGHVKRKGDSRIKTIKELTA